MEAWKQIKGYEGYYEVSDLARVKSIHRIVPGKKKKTVSERILKCGYDSTGYYRVWLTKDQKTRTKAVHRLVYEAFMEDIPKNYQVDHKDGDKKNNRLANLQLLSRQEHRILTVGRSQHASGERVGNSKLKEKQVKEIKLLLKERGITQKEIAKRFNVHGATIAAIACGRTWVEPNEDIGIGSLQKSITFTQKKSFQEGYSQGYSKGFSDGLKKKLQ